MKISEKIKSETLKVSNEIYKFSFSSQHLNYKSSLIGFNKNLYSLFDSHYESLNVSEAVRELFRGEIVNKTENQAALHHVYRDVFAKKPNNFLSKDFMNSCKDSINVSIKLKDSLLKKGIKNIVSIGIGGSYEGPKLLIKTLINKNNQNFNHTFLTGPDITEFFETVEHLNQKETFFIVSSKSFATDEILQTLALSKKWLELKCNFDDHFFAVTSKKQKAEEYGFKNHNIIKFPEEIGGRYSIWSPISLPAILELGKDFIDFLIGGFEADNHLLSDKKYCEFLKLICFSDIWYNNFLNKHTRVLLTYSWKMRFLSDYIQQLEMESLGKKSNSPIFKNTGQVLFGGFGPTAQHSYFQLLHQGTSELCSDIYTLEDNIETNKLLYAQSHIQSNLMANGKNEDLNSFEQVNGNIPINLFSLKELSPKSFGYLIATLEHRTYITSKILEINSFDQYGVNAGKVFTKKYLDNNGG